jgi:outer membrane protein TolC
METTIAALLVLAAVTDASALPGPSGPPLTEDPVLAAIVKEAMARRPELASVRALIRAEQERVPQTGALPDPTLTLGIQNDGFSGIQIGKMETSFLAVTASQTFPWAGKRRLRGEVTDFGRRAAELDLRRAQLSIAADVERAYLDLLLARDQLGLLAKLESLWSQSEGLARARYEAGEAAQSDFFRAQLERDRLRQRRWALEAEERRRIVVLNRLRGHEASEPIATTLTLSDLPDPVLPDPNQAMASAEAESPELKRALLAGEQAGRNIDLAQRERWPDVTLTAGLMPRWGNFETMWQAAVGVNLPVWTARKQGRAIAENQARREAASYGAEAIRQILRQRVVERLMVLRPLVEANRLYRAGLLVRSEATVTTTQAQYQVGRVSFASVLEALAGYLADRNGYLDSVATAQRIVIAEREISLESPGGAGSGGTGGAAMPGTAGAASSSPSTPAPAARGSEGGGSPSMGRM